MKPPIEHVRVSAKGKEILIKVKRRTGLEHWNEICRIALCRSLANPTLPPKVNKSIESSIDMDWKTFVGSHNNEITSIIVLRAFKDGINTSRKDLLMDYFRAHLERGINSLQTIQQLSDIVGIGK